VLELLLADIVTAVLLAHLLAMTYTVFFAMYGSASRLVPLSVSVGMPLLVILTFLLVLGVDFAVLGLDRVWPRALFFFWQLAAFWTGIIVCWSILRKLYAILRSTPLNPQLPNQGPRFLLGVLGACTVFAMLASYPMALTGKKLLDDKNARPTAMRSIIDAQAIFFSVAHVSCLALSIWWNWRPIAPQQTVIFACCITPPKNNNNRDSSVSGSLTETVSTSLLLASQTGPSFSQMVDERLIDEEFGL
jgi:hypothetical protein